MNQEKAITAQQIMKKKKLNFFILKSLKNFTFPLYYFQEYFSLKKRKGKLPHLRAAYTKIARSHFRIFAWYRHRKEKIALDMQKKKKKKAIDINQWVCSIPKLIKQASTQSQFLEKQHACDNFFVPIKIDAIFIMLCLVFWIRFSWITSYVEYYFVSPHIVYIFP